MKDVSSNMAGVVQEVKVAVGDTVSAGDDVVVLESMKMQIPVQSELAGKVAALRVNVGDFVNAGDVLLQLE